MTIFATANTANTDNVYNVIFDSFPCLSIDKQANYNNLLLSYAYDKSNFVLDIDNNYKYYVTKTFYVDNLDCCYISFTYSFDLISKELKSSYIIADDYNILSNDEKLKVFLETEKLFKKIIIELCYNAKILLNCFEKCKNYVVEYKQQKIKCGNC